jgi:hypothetical protein
MGKDYCSNTTAVPRDDLHRAAIASLRKTFSGKSLRAHQQRVANDTEAQRRGEAQRAHWTAELPIGSRRPSESPRPRASSSVRYWPAPIAVRPTGKGTWAFAGFSRYDEVLKGGIGVAKGSSTILSELPADSETAEKTMAHLKTALAASVARHAARGRQRAVHPARGR